MRETDTIANETKPKGVESPTCGQGDYPAGDLKSGRTSHDGNGPGDSDQRFRGLGPGIEKREREADARQREILAHMREDLKKEGLSDRDVNSKIDEHARAAVGPFEERHPEKGQEYFKVISTAEHDKNKEKGEVPRTTGFRVSGDKLEQLQERPEALRHVGLAIPEKSWSQPPHNKHEREAKGSGEGTYEIYKTKVTDEEAARCYVSRIAPTVEGMGPDHAKLYQMGGALEMRMEKGGSSRETLSGEQIHILSSDGFSKMEHVGRFTPKEKRD